MDCTQQHLPRLRMNAGRDGLFLAPIKWANDFPTLRKEAETAIKSLKNWKAAGVDYIPAELIKQGGTEMMDLFTRICNKIWQTGEWSTPWTQSLIITLPKKGNLQQCQNYRAISLISHASKVMQKVILNRLKSMAEEVIAEEQAGFHPQKKHHRTNIQPVSSVREI